MKRLFVCLLCLTLLLTGCTLDPGEQVEITLIHGWGSTDDDHAAMRRIYAAFEEKNPDIRLNLISMPTMEELVRKLEDSIMVGEIPDIIFLAGQGRHSIYDYMVAHGYALDLMPYLEADPQLAACIPDQMRDYWTTTHNRLYTVSDVMMIGGGYWYNREIARSAGITEVPDSWPEFAAACRKIDDWAAAGHRKIHSMHPSKEGYLYFLNHILAQRNLSAGTEPGSFTDGQMRDALTFMEQLYQLTSASGADLMEYNYRDETSLFNAGKLAIYVNGVWGASMIHPDIDAAYALFPYDDQTISCESSAVGYVLGQTGDTAAQNASIRFLKYMLSEPVQEQILLETQQMPANPNIVIEDYADRMPRFCNAISKAASAQCRIEIPQQLWNEQQLTFFEQNILDVLSGKLQKQTLIDLLKR